MRVKGREEWRIRKSEENVGDCRESNENWDRDRECDDMGRDGSNQ
jgi:hypothetical protein